MSEGPPSSAQLSGTTERPRLVVHRSNEHIYVQVIDDVKMMTVASASTVEKEVREACPNNNIEAATTIGKRIAQASHEAMHADPSLAGA